MLFILNHILIFKKTELIKKYYKTIQDIKIKLFWNNIY